MELFDPKPDLASHAGQTFGEKVEMFQKGSEANKLLASPFKFRPAGRSGVQLSEVIPHLASVVDDYCLIRSMHTEHNNHTEALVMFNTGKIFPGRPALGSWVSYALGTVNQNLPAYIVLRDPEGYNTSGTLLWQNAWLPALYRGTEFSSQGPAVLNLRGRVAQPEGAQRDDLELLARLNEEHRRRYPHESELDARIRNYELAARMQLATGETLDLSHETETTQKLYGLDSPETAGYGLRCLMAPPAGRKRCPLCADLPARQTAVPTLGFAYECEDRERGHLQQDRSAERRPDHRFEATRPVGFGRSSLWSGEFGRLPVSQNGSGRDHNRNAFSLIVTGGGFKRGHVHGTTDEVGYRAADDRMSVSDLHATLLHQLGFDHRRLAFVHHGRPETLTDAPLTKARVVGEVLEQPVRV